MDDVKFLESIKLNNTDSPTFHGVGTYPSTGGQILDHTFASGKGYEAVQYQYVLNDWSINSTDHIPLLLDIDLSAE